MKSASNSAKQAWLLDWHQSLIDSMLYTFMYGDSVQVRYDSTAWALEQVHYGYYNKVKLVGVYLMQLRYADAINLLNQIPSEFNLSDDEITDVRNMADMYVVIDSLRHNGQNWDVLTSSMKQEVHSVANASGLYGQAVAIYLLERYENLMLLPQLPVLPRPGQPNGIKEQLSPGSKIYPNPTNGLIYINWESREKTYVKIYNSMGNFVLKSPLHSGLNGLNLRALPNGIYFIHVYEKGQSVYQQKIVKKIKMMTFLKIKKIMLPLAVLFYLLPSFSFGQQVIVNKLYYFAGQDKICFTYPDSNCIYALGEEHVQDSATKIFTAAFDYNGNLLWKKDIRISPLLRPSVKDGFKNLIKLSPDLYVAGGNLNHYPLSGNDRGAAPFLYFFDAHGDSLNFVTLEDTAAARWLTALHKISDNRFMAAGTDSILHYNGPLGQYDDTTVSAWLLRLNDTGQTNLYKKINLPHITFISKARAVISGIHTVSGDSVRYLINTIFPDGSPGSPVRLNIETDVDFRKLGAYILDQADGYLTPDGFHIIDHPISLGAPLTFSSTPENSPMPGSYFYIGSCMTWKQGYFDAVNFDAAFLCRFDLPPIEPPLGYNTYPCPGFGLSSATWLKPLGLGLSDTTGPLGHVFFMFRSLQQNFHYNHLIQAPNGDLLALKEVNLPSDSTNTPLYYYEVPVFFRADSSNGHIRWSMPVQYKSTIDTTVEEHLYDMETAPNGKVVLAGFVNGHSPTPGYDSTGENSWLVILDDSVHDHHTDGIVLLSAGQQANILVYPNPAINYTTIDLQNFKGNMDEMNYQVCDIAGKILQNREIKNAKTTISLNGYTPGIYFIKIRYQGRPVGGVKLFCR